MRRLLRANATGRGADMGLQRMERGASALGLFKRPAIKWVHVAGTNGKGSVCHKIASALPGRKVGVYTSPHVGTYRERILLDGSMISEEQADATLQRIEAVEASEGMELTYFEKLTLLALAHLDAEVDVAIVEAGLGGALDATNVIPRPDVCVLTSVALEHTRFLGNTLEEIARNKAGIFKPGCHAIVGPRAEPIDVLQDLALRAQVGSFLRVQVPEKNADDVDAENSHVALHALRALGQARVGLEDLLGKRPPGRFERLVSPAGADVLLDGAHNPDALSRLGRQLSRDFAHKQAVLVLALSADKDLRGAVEALLRELPSDKPPRLFLCRGDNDARSASMEQLAELARAIAPLVHGGGPVELFDSTIAAFRAAEHAALAETSGLVVVSGSFNAIGAVRHMLVPPETMELDEINMNENRI